MSTRSARRRQPAMILFGLFTVPCWWAVGCVYEPDDRCSPGQVVVEFDRCACAPGLVAVDGVCQPCPEHEIERGGACVCDEGYARAAQGSPCELEAPGLGVACNDDGDCVEAPFTHCQTHPLGDYCTQTDCATSDDCAGGYACDTAASPAYCKRPPTGQSAPCTSQDDCADYEASYCEVVQGRVCLVSGCDTDPNIECFLGWECCHAGESFGLPTLCVPAGECPQ